MAFPGETIALGAPNTCPDCGKKMQFRTLSSASGYYVGTWCCCGPYTRETIYTKEHIANQLCDIMNMPNGLMDRRVISYLRS